MNRLLHEFNNQLTVITGFCDLLLNQIAHDPKRGDLLQVRKAAEAVLELRNALERMCMRSGGRVSAATSPSSGSARAIPEMTRQQIERALQQAGGNRSAAARLLGIHRRAFYRRLEEFGLK